MEVQMPLLEGDFSLNAANLLSADLLFRQGLSCLTPTHDLNAAQIAALASNLGPQRCGVLSCNISRLSQAQESVLILLFCIDASHTCQV